MTQYFLYLLIGKLFIFLGGKFTEFNNYKLDRPLKGLWDLLNCDLCFGFWVYLFLSWGTSTYLFYDVYQSHPFIMGLITGGVSSFVMHLLTIGFKEKFLVIEIT